MAAAKPSSLVDVCAVHCNGYLDQFRKLPDGACVTFARHIIRSHRIAKLASAVGYLVTLVLCLGCSGNSTRNDLGNAVKSHDPGTILRAFHAAIYNRSAEMSEALPAIQSYLKDPDPWVRYLAAMTLYTAGDQSGFATLVELIGSPEPIPEPLEGSKEDLRRQAARLLIKFRQREAAVPYLVQLHERTKDDYILHGIVSLLKQQTPKDILAHVLEKKEPVFRVFNLSLAKSPETRSLAEELFRDPKVPTVYQEHARQIAAWAMARSKDDVRYVRYLVEAAEPAIDGRQKANGINESTNALRYLGSIQHPLAREALERALESPNHFAVEIAVVNLLFNQPGGSEKARQVILHQLKGLPMVMGSWESTLQIAAKLNGPEMRAAGEAFDRRSSVRSWQLYAVQRKDWPIYNWIDDYVVELTQQ